MYNRCQNFISIRKNVIWELDDSIHSKEKKELRFIELVKD